MDTNPSPATRLDARPLSWTRPLAEAYWRSVHAARLPAAEYERGLANVLAGTMRSALPPGARVLEFGGRTAEAVAALLWAGFEVTRLDAFAEGEPAEALVAGAPGWQGGTAEVADGRFDALAAVDGPARLLDAELPGFAALARRALRPGGLLCFTVPNGATLPYEMAVDPEAGILYHPLQHQRGYTHAAVEAWLEAEGFSVLALHQLGLEAYGAAEGDHPFDRMATDRRLYLGNGGTMVVLARRRSDLRMAAGGPDRAQDPARAAALVAEARAARAAAPQGPAPHRLDWTGESIGRFWSFVATSALDELSFGAQNGATVLRALEPWLSPRGRHIDIGAGNGHVVELLAAAGYRAGALEPSPGRRAGIDRRLAGRPGYLGCFDAPDPAGGFDVALAFEVIEHVGDEDLPGFLGLIRDCLVPDGVLLLSTPHAEDLARSDVCSPVTGLVHHRWQHMQSWTEARLAALLEREGFTVEVTHVVDLGAISRGRHPLHVELLGGARPRRIGAPHNLICVARKGPRRLGPTQDAWTMARRAFLPPAAPPSQPAAAAPEPRAASQPMAAAAEAAQSPTAPRAPRLRPRALASRARSVARRVLPRPVKLRLARLLDTAGRLQRALAWRPALPLAGAPAILPPEAFRGGPVLHVNNALAWGGVERQVVNTLRGLEVRTDRRLGLLCLRLGAGADYEFFRPALQGWRGFVRNVMEAGPAEAALSQALSAQQMKAAERRLSWMPGDVRDETLRFLAEFLTLRPEVVHAWQDAASISAGHAARLAGVPRIILSSRNVNPTNFAYYRPYMLEGYRRLAACPEITLVNNSEAGAADYAAWLGLPAARWTVKRNGIDAGGFLRAAPADAAGLRARLGIPADSPVVGAVFRLYDEKRPMLWLRAAALVARRVPACHFVVFGTGPRREEMLRLAAESGMEGRLHLPGTIAPATLGLSILDVFLLASEFEGTPNVVLEASALGVPVVATAAGGTAEAVAEGRTGLLVQEASPEALAERVCAVLDDLSAWRARAAEGVAFVEERFGLERMLRETLGLYGIAAEGGTG